MFEIVDYSAWHKYDGLDAGSGRSKKVWLQSDTGEIVLFKFPKIDAQTNVETSEHISEHLAHQIGNILGVPTARVELGTYNGKIGSASYLARQENEAVIEGLLFISGDYPRYNDKTLIDEETGNHYCVDMIFNAASFMPEEYWAQMMLFDFVIGNTDRHHSNWAVIASASDSGGKRSFQLRPCPFYDNGSSLCSFVNEMQVDRYFGKDKGPITALVESQSKTVIRIGGSRGSKPRHIEMVKYMLSKLPVTRSIANSFTQKLTSATIDELLSNYGSDILSDKKQQLIRQFLKLKMAGLLEILEECT